MAVSPALLCPPLFCLELPLTFKPALSGMQFSRVSPIHRPQANETYSIYRPAKPASQSGTWHSHHWRMDWDILQKGHRWENPLMGWQSSADGMQGTNIKFKSKEDAIAFAQKQGYEYFVQEPNERRFVPKAYANNFLHEHRKLKHIKTK
jgi:NADH dehydrogenase (ubiquinone) Fe-S protein 4